MKNITSPISHLLNLRGRKPARTVYQQLELSLPGSRLTRDEADFLVEIRRLREKLSNARN
ncbi:MAG: hypothetical protein Fur0032_06380 [Terrimicrobiaceae bacterium]